MLQDNTFSYDQFTLGALAGIDPVVWANEVVKIESALGKASKLDDWQEKVIRSSHRNILLNCSRQMGKSTVCAIKAAHRALFRRNQVILIVAKTHPQALRLFDKVRETLEKHEDFVGKKLDRVKDNEDTIKLRDTNSIIIAAASTSDSIRGLTINLYIEDEAAWVADSVHDAIVPSLSASRGQKVLLSTPDGCRGHFYNAWTSEADYERYEVPANFARVSKEDVDRWRIENGQDFVDQEYYCKFRSPGASVFKEELIKDGRDPGLMPFSWVRPA